MGRRVFSPKFKLEAVRLVRERGAAVLLPTSVAGLSLRAAWAGKVRVRPEANTKALSLHLSEG